MWWFTADEHYGHERVIALSRRPFISVSEMNERLISNHNAVVRSRDITVHVGDFGFFRKEAEAQQVIQRLNGSHIFVKGSHDRWLPKGHPMMWRKTLDGILVTACHYALRTWEQAHKGSWSLYGHSHGTLPPMGKQWDVGVDCNDFRPVSLEELKNIMDRLPMLHAAGHDKPLERINE